MKKVFFMLGFIFALGILFLTGSVVAGPKQCPLGQRGNCNTWEQKQTGKQGCFSVNANLGDGWFYLRSGCKDVLPKQPIATNTMLPIIPTNTPENNEQPSDPDNGDQKEKQSIDVSRDVFYVESWEECPEDCICLLVTQAIIQNKILLTQNAIMESNE